MNVTVYCLSTTVTLHEALTPLPSLAVAVMVAVPAALAVTLPLASTVTKLVLLLLQVMDLSSASSGVTVAVRVNTSSSVRVTEEWLRVMHDTNTNGSILPKLLQGAVVLYLFNALAGTCKVAFETFELSKRPLPTDGSVSA